MAINTAKVSITSFDLMCRPALMAGVLGRAECGPNPLGDPIFGVTWRVYDEQSVGLVSMSRESGFQQRTTPANSGVDCDTMRLVLSQEAQT